MLNNFSKHTTQVEDTHIHYAIGGSGPPLLLLHGYPQTHVMWHKIAPQLAKQFTVIASDLRGYGASGKPPTDAQHTPYSKRSMAKDQVQLMTQLGFERFRLVGHDRGGRVGHRLALDYPDRVEQLVVMDIAPTHCMYTTTDFEFAKAYYHWFFLIQAHDIPERMIGADPRYFLSKKLGQWGRDSKAFTEAAFQAYLDAFTPQTIHASCEDYRASASIDLVHDQMDLNQGNKIQCPMLCLYGKKGFVGNKYDMSKEWGKWADNILSYGLPCGHYLPEEAPEATLTALLQFL